MSKFYLLGTNKELKNKIDDISLNIDFVKKCEIDIKAVGSIVYIDYKEGDFGLKFGEIILEDAE